MSDSEEALHPRDEEQRVFVLVTGANSGLGFGICCRLIDEFIHLRPSFQSLTLLPTTRDIRKSNETVSRLQKHLRYQSQKLDEPLSTRVTLQPEELDLTSLSSIQTFSAKLVQTTPHLDTIICNAGSGGTTGINWTRAIWTILTNTLPALTYPQYKLSSIGDTTPSQIFPSSANDITQSSSAQPPLGQVFTSNVFGHYILSHSLTPLLAACPDAGRIIFVSSLEAYASAFNTLDFQGLTSPKAYEASKRLTDLLVLTSPLSSTAPFVKRFLSPSPSTPRLGNSIQLNDNDPSPSPLEEARHITLSDNENRPSASLPQIYLAHPGICSTSFIPLPLILFYVMTCAFYIARLVGSPWHTVSVYKGACAPVWLALTAQEELEDLETEAGKGKWGSACDAMGNERVTRTEVEGWGMGGRVGVEAAGQRAGGGRGGDVTREGREAFEELGRECWATMEELRVEWEERMTRVE